MSDLILSLPHYDHRHIAIYVVQIIDMMLSCMCLTGFAFYIAVRCGFDKHLYLTNCLNANNHGPIQNNPRQHGLSFETDSIISHLSILSAQTSLSKQVLQLCNE